MEALLLYQSDYESDEEPSESPPCKRSCKGLANIGKNEKVAVLEGGVAGLVDSSTDSKRTEQIGSRITSFHSPFEIKTVTANNQASVIQHVAIAGSSTASLPAPPFNDDGLPTSVVSSSVRGSLQGMP